MARLLRFRIEHFDKFGGHDFEATRQIHRPAIRRLICDTVEDIDAVLNAQRPELPMLRRKAQRPYVVAGDPTQHQRQAGPTSEEPGSVESISIPNCERLTGAKVAGR